MLGVNAILPVPFVVKAQARECKNVLGFWSGRPMNCEFFDRFLVSDASDFALGAIDLSTSRMVHDLVPLDMHINAK